MNRPVVQRSLGVRPLDGLLETMPAGSPACDKVTEAARLIKECGRIASPPRKNLCGDLDHYALQGRTALAAFELKDLPFPVNSK